MKLPKQIHYCWFGRNPLDDTALRCIESWKRFFPDYEIIQWNEDNFDISSCSFMQKAYDDKKWAFVSDVARLMIVYEHGGIYFDTDVEVIAPYDDILSSNAEGFIGIETTKYVSSGLGFGAQKGCALLRHLIEVYQKIDYEEHNHQLSDIACTILTTAFLEQHGLLREDKKQRVCDIDIYPTEYFSPINYDTGKLVRTSNTHSIHWYSASWLSEAEKDYTKKAQKLSRFLGRSLADHVLGISVCIKQEGLFSYIWKRVRKYILVKKS